MRSALVALLVILASVAVAAAPNEPQRRLLEDMCIVGEPMDKNGWTYEEEQQFAIYANRWRREHGDIPKWMTYESRESAFCFAFCSGVLRDEWYAAPCNPSACSDTSDRKNPCVHLNEKRCVQAPQSEEWRRTVCLDARNLLTTSRCRGVLADIAKESCQRRLDNDQKQAAPANK